ncbi:MAG: UvrB/UvrC motif-containing protein [Clostridia bacterium]|nr:UvrB/UvrC motif-containing protein [Clostridia bacterium]
MLCEHCGKNVANTHVKRTINGKTYEAMLCPECAAEMGFGSLMGTINLGSLLGSTFTEALSGKRIAENQIVCPQCGASFSDITQTGRVGCAKCYEIFYDRLVPSLQRIHGKTRHAGKLPSGAGIEAKRRNELDSLRQQLAQAVENQEYEKAAQLRDSIRGIEEKEGDGNEG